jgi:hypothetical protein
MSQQIINIGASPNDGLGDPIRTAFEKTNENFTQLYANSVVPNTIVNGTSNVKINSANADVTVGVNGSSNVVIITSNGLSVNGNVAGNYIFGNGALLTGISSGSANTGNVTFDDVNIIGTGSLNLQPDPANSGAYLDIYLTTGPDIHIAGNSENVIVGTDGGANVTVGVNGDVTIQASTGNAFTWIFGSDATTTFPGNLVSNGGSPAPSINGFDTINVAKVSAVGTVISNGVTNGTAFVAGNGAQNQVAMAFQPDAGIPAQMAIRDYSTVNSTIYFDTTVGSANTGGSFQFRGSNAFTSYANISSIGISVSGNVVANGNLSSTGAVIKIADAGANAIAINGAGIVAGANVATILYDNSVFGWTVNQGWHPSANATYNLGRTNRLWNNVYANNITTTDVTTTPVPLANLTAVAGSRAFINNANLVASGNFGAQVSGSGSNVVPVWSDGTNWYIG